MKLNWNFLGGEGVQNKNLPWGEYGYFLELHIACKGGDFTAPVEWGTSPTWGPPLSLKQALN